MPAKLDVRKDRDTGEYKILWLRDGRRYEPWSCYTPDEEDAADTLLAQVVFGVGKKIDFELTSKASKFLYRVRPDLKPGGKIDLG